MRHSIEAYKNRLQAASVGIAEQFYFGYREDVNKILDKNRYPVIIAEWPTWELTKKDSITVLQTILIGTKGTSPIRAVDTLQDLLTLYVAAIDDGGQYFVSNANDAKRVFISPEGMTADSSTWLRIELIITMYCAASPVETVTGYGLIYNSAAIDLKPLAPNGWTVMSDADWALLFDEIATIVGANNLEAGALKADSDEWPAFNMILGNRTTADFKALPTGYRDDEGAFLERGTAGYWWETGAEHNRKIKMDATMDADSHDHTTGYGYSVRLYYSGAGVPDSILTDINGNNYNVVKIGSRYYIDADYRCVTQNNGIKLEWAQSDEDWIAAEGAAYCEYE